jgi:hypothetical protein
MSKSIPLSQGKSALVDDEDYDRLNAYEWFLSGTGYAVGFVPRDDKFRLEYLHRFITQAAEGQLVDHINGDSLDNRQTNLRFATPRQNVQNKRLSSLSLTGLKGVGYHRDRRKYHARIQLQGICFHLGFFDDAKTAALAYDEAARLLFGEFAACNYADQQPPQAVATAVRERLQHRGWPPE